MNQGISIDIYIYIYTLRYIHRYIYIYIYFIDGNNSLRFVYGWLMVFNATFNNISVISEMTEKNTDFFFYNHGRSINTVKPAHVVTSIKQSPVLKGHLFHVLS
jgi:hypothetical protein